MKSIILEYPVITIYDEVLVKAGTNITIDNISQIIPENKNIFKTVPFLKSKNIESDIIKNLSKEPYISLFKNFNFDELINLMKCVQLPIPVIESLYLFRKKDNHTYTHFLMVFALTTLLSKDIISDKDLLIRSITAGSTHDIGKICIPEHILKKASPLTIKEKNILKQHTVYGYILLSYYFNNDNSHMAEIARDHHERMDGSGYPFRIKMDNNDITDIVIICDIFDALVSSRPYRPEPYSVRSAIEEITEMAVTCKIDWKVIKALVNILRTSDTHYSQCKVSLEKRSKGPDLNYYGVFDESESIV